MEDGSTCGRRSCIFEYNGKKLVSIAEYNHRKEEEIRRVKNLKPTTNSPWIRNTRKSKTVDSRLWEENGLDRVQRVGPKMLQQLNEAGIEKVKQLKDLPINVRRMLVKSGVKESALDAAVEKCSSAKEGSFPDAVVDHRAALNPYESRFPDDHEVKLKNSSALKPFVCVTDLISWMIKESHRMMRGTVHAEDWYFYHDALSLMTASATMKWMSESFFGGVSIKSRWLVPQKGCNGDTVYKGRVVGNSLEFMPLDNSLFADLKAFIGASLYCHKKIR